MNNNDLSGEIGGVIRVYKFTKTSFWGTETSRVYIPILSIDVKEADGSTTYRHFSIDKDGDILEDPSDNTLTEIIPYKEWLYHLFSFPQETDARLQLTTKFIEFKNNYDDTTIKLVDTLKVKFKENKKNKNENNI